MLKKGTHTHRCWRKFRQRQGVRFFISKMYRVSYLNCFIFLSWREIYRKVFNSPFTWVSHSQSTRLRHNNAVKPTHWQDVLLILTEFYWLPFLTTAWGVRPMDQICSIIWICMNTLRSRQHAVLPSVFITVDVQWFVMWLVSVIACCSDIIIDFKMPFKLAHTKIAGRTLQCQPHQCVSLAQI